MRVEHEKIRLESVHFNRLFEGLAFLQFPLPSYFTELYLREQILRLCADNLITGPIRVRLTVFRDQPFNTAPENFQYLIQCFPLDPAYTTFNEDGLTIDICPGIVKSIDRLSNLKSNNYLPYLLAGMHARNTGLQDCLVMNVQNRIADSSIANVFCIKDELIETPPLSEGCINGVMRKFLLSTLPRFNWRVKEKTLTANDLENADEVFLTNALFGLRWVGKFRNANYSHLISREIYEKVISTI